MTKIFLFVLIFLTIGSNAMDAGPKIHKNPINESSFEYLNIPQSLDDEYYQYQDEKVPEEKEFNHDQGES